MLQAREISVPTSSRSAFPRALKKIVFPRARVPKTPGTRERESRNARPALSSTSLAFFLYSSSFSFFLSSAYFFSLFLSYSSCFSFFLSSSYSFSFLSSPLISCSFSYSPLIPSPSSNSLFMLFLLLSYSSVLSTFPNFPFFYFSLFLYSSFILRFLLLVERDKKNCYLIVFNFF